MAIFKSKPPPSQDLSSSLRLPASKRIQSSASMRLSTILESGRAASPPPAVPKRTSMRSDRTSVGAVPLTQHPAFRSQETLRSGPPAYGITAPSINDSEDLNAPVEGEKLNKLRREDAAQGKSRGGWWRIALIALIALVVVGLAVGLGVGLTVGRSNTDTSFTNSTVGPSTPVQSSPQWPIGNYSFVTALYTQQTNCSAEAATWRCFPYTTLAQSNTSSQASFNWQIANTSANYAQSSTGATSSSGVPANLTISSDSNPFTAARFTNQNLTYYSDSSNSSSSRYEFSFVMSKMVVPSPAITSNGQASECFFNSTTFRAVIYLNSARKYPDPSLWNSTALGGSTQWPYAVDISQVSLGGANTPDCYETVNSVITSRIVNGLDPQPASSQCICDYRNY